MLSQTLILVALVDFSTSTMSHFFKLQSSYTAESLPATIRRAKDTDLHRLHPIGPNLEGEVYKVEFKHH